MNIQILPNWFKRIALVVFIVSSILSQGDDFIQGFNDGMSYTSNKSPQISQDFITNMIGGKQNAYYFKIITLASLLTYLLSKEKIEDDYIKLLRLETYQLSFLIIVIVAFIFFVLGKEHLYNLYDSVQVFLWLYLIIFFLKKHLV